MMDDARAEALCAAVAQRSSRGCEWRELAAEGCLPDSVRQFLRAAGWEIDDERGSGTGAAR